ncbi:hypothetical protein, partial [Streptomyces sp. NPDC058953]|uniref:hypothetical protein n=1 Tax=Streptomyces sp. NPDC058953 TaxID=3346676 RepID=UPI00367F6A4B
MDHEVFVPVPAETVRRLLGDPVRAARCVPGFREDDAPDAAGDAPDGAADATLDDGELGVAAPGGWGVGGRLKVRVGNLTITYRGTLRVAGLDSVFTVEGNGTEARGDGSVRFALTVRTTADQGGTTLAFSGGTRAEGRLAEASDAARESAARRLLDRFAEALAAEAANTDPDADTAAAAAAHDEDDDGVVVDDEGDEGDQGEEGGAGYGTVVPPVPPPGLADGISGALSGPVGDEPVAEAAHARRTMIGRSAEEVDHSPPRGRYAPRPAPDAGRAGPPPPAGGHPPGGGARAGGGRDPPA